MLPCDAPAGCRPGILRGTQAAVLANQPQPGQHSMLPCKLGLQWKPLPQLPHSPIAGEPITPIRILAELGRRFGQQLASIMSYQPLLTALSATVFLLGTCAAKEWVVETNSFLIREPVSLGCPALHPLAAGALLLRH